MVFRVFLLLSLFVFSPIADANQGGLLLKARVFPSFSFRPIWAGGNRLNFRESIRSNISRDRFQVIRENRQANNRRYRMITIIIN